MEALIVVGLLVLFGDGEVRIDSSVDENEVLGFVVVLGITDEVPMFLENIAEGASVVIEGVLASTESAQEAFAISAGLEGSYHLDLVVAHEVDGAVCIAEGEKVVDDAFGIGAAIDVVPKGHDQVVFLRLCDLKKGAQGGEAAVNISNDQLHLGEVHNVGSFFSQPLFLLLTVSDD